MKKVIHYLIFITVIATLFAVQRSHAEEGKNGNLVTVQWLKKYHNDEHLVVIDASPAKSITQIIFQAQSIMTYSHTAHVNYRWRN